MKPRQQRGFSLFELPANPLLVFVSQHGFNHKGKWPEITPLDCRRGRLDARLADRLQKAVAHVWVPHFSRSLREVGLLASSGTNLVYSMERNRGYPKVRMVRRCCKAGRVACGVTNAKVTILATPLKISPLFLSTTYLRPIPHLTAKPRFSPVRCLNDAHLLPLQ